MKIVACDNFDRDNVSEYVVAEGLNEEDAKEKCNAMNAEQDEHADRFYRVFPDDYVPFVWEP